MKSLFRTLTNLQPSDLETHYYKFVLNGTKNNLILLEAYDGGGWLEASGVRI